MYTIREHCYIYDEQAHLSFFVRKHTGFTYKIFKI